MKNKKTIFTAILAIIGIIIVTVLVTIMAMKQSRSQVTGVIVNEGVIPGYTPEQIEEMLQRKADESMFSFEVNSRPFFENGKEEGTLRIYNPPYNMYKFDVEVTLDSSGDTIFKSPILNPNQYIEKAKLLKTLEKGQYDATAIITAYSDEGEVIGISNAKLIITIEN